MNINSALKMLSTAVLLACLSPFHASAFTLTDTDFDDADWLHNELIVVEGGPLTTNVNGQAAFGGNPGSYQRGVVDWGPGGIYISHLFSSGTPYDPSQQGAVSSIDFEFDLLVSGANPRFSGNEIAAMPLLKQGSDYFVATSRGGSADLRDGWVPIRRPGILSSHFSLITPAGVNNAANPDFSPAGSPLQFGYFARSTTGSTVGREITWGLDNWSVEINQPDALVYLDRFNPLPAGKHLIRESDNPDARGKFLSWDPGIEGGTPRAETIANASENVLAQLEEVIERSTAAYLNAGVNVKFSMDPADASSAETIIHFSNEVPTIGSYRAAGRYTTQNVPDRFNENISTDRVIAYVPEGAINVERLAKTIIHEVGHSFGLYHIDRAGFAMSAPNLPDGDRFFGQVANRVKNFNGRLRPVNGTHNPQYHLQEFVGDSSELASGTWDRTGSRIDRILINSRQFIRDVVLHGVTIDFGFSLWEGIPNGGGEIAFESILLSELLEQSFMDEGEGSFAIYAQSSPDGPLDIFFENSDGGLEIDAGVGGDFTVVQWMEDGTSVTLATGVAMRVPEPSSPLLVAVAFLTLASRRRMRLVLSKFQISC